MSSSGSHAHQPGDAGLPSAEELRDFKWVAPESSSSPAIKLRSRSLAPDAIERAERVNAGIVIGLTLACTVLSLFDLFLLASGL